MAPVDIIENNKKLGIETRIYSSDNGILGYTEDGIIYLNEFYYNDLEIVNKHEIMHLFEDTKQFKGIKKIILELLKDKIDDLRQEYYLKYGSLYSKEDIDKGILDTEIAIDIIIGNHNLGFNINDYLDDAYNQIINQKETIKLTTKGKRYLSLNVSKNLKNRYPNLDKWEILFVNQYYFNREKPLGKYRNEQIIIDIQNALLALYAESEHSIRINAINNEAIDRKYESLIKAYEAKGDYSKADELKNSPIITKIEMAKEITESLHDQLSNIKKLLLDSNYTDAFRYLILKETLTNTYRYENGKRIVEKRDPHKSILPHMILNKYILDEIYKNIDKYDNFADLYFDALEKYNNEFLKNDGIVFATTEKGYWIKFDGGNDVSEEQLRINAQNLGNLIINTPWCTRKIPEKHLSEGDFYVFVDNYNIPRIAVKLNGHAIDEVRGIENFGDQQIEDEYRDVAIDFLRDNIGNLSNVEDWLDKETRNERLHQYLIKLRNGNLSDEELYALVKDLNQSEKNLHQGVNVNEKELINIITKDTVLRNRIVNISEDARKVLEIIDTIECNYRILEYCKKLKEGTLKEEDIEQLYSDLFFTFYEYEYIDNQNELKELINSTDNILRRKMAEKYNCSIDEIYIGDLDNENLRFIDGKILPYKVILGSLDLRYKQDIDASNLCYVLNDVCAYQTKNIDFSNLKEIGGNLDVIEAKNANFSSLEIIRGNIDAFHGDCNFSSLKSIYGIADFEVSYIEYLNSLEYVGGDLRTKYSRIKEMNNLKIVEGTIGMSQYTNIKDLPSLEKCNGFYDTPEYILSKFICDFNSSKYVRYNKKRN